MDDEQFNLTTDEQLLLGEDPEIPDHQVEDVYLFGQTWHVHHGGHYYAIAPPGNPFPNGFNGQPVQVGYPSEDEDEDPYAEYEDPPGPDSPVYTPIPPFEWDEYNAVLKSRMCHSPDHGSEKRPLRTVHYFFQEPVPREDFVE